MKGTSSAAELLAKVLITIFIVGMIFILLMTFLPNFSDETCKQKQVDDINRVINDAIAARTTQTTKLFTVHSCIEYIDFTPVGCEIVRRGGAGNDVGRCYEVLLVGQNSGNCEQSELTCNRNENELIEGCSNDCGQRKGTFVQMPGTLGTFSITGDTKLTKGDYTATIGPYSIKFSKRETN